MTEPTPIHVAGMSLVSIGVWLVGRREIEAREIAEREKVGTWLVRLAFRWARLWWCCASGCDAFLAVWRRERESAIEMECEKERLPYSPGDSGPLHRVFDSQGQPLTDRQL